MKRVSVRTKDAELLEISTQLAPAVCIEANKRDHRKVQLGLSTIRHPGRRAWVTWALFGLIFAYGMYLRCWGLGDAPFWVDEAESSINALTILQHGLPVDRYQGVPIFENALSEPWPQSSEWEFKDTSYSRRGLAIYHGWLPLYSIAAAFKIAGAHPDDVTDGVTIRYTPGQTRWRVIAARVPAVLFSAVFLIVIYFAAKIMYGEDAAWTALIVGCVCRPAIEFARQARYYSATLTLSVCCCLAVWMMFRRGWWRDFLAAAILFTLLFHTHILTFFILCGASLMLLPGILRQYRAFAKSSVFGAIILAGTLPWMLFTGFLDAAPKLPPARSLFNFPIDLFDYPISAGPVSIIFILGIFWIVASFVWTRRLGNRWLAPIKNHRTVIIFLAGWAIVGFAAFTLLIPAASYFRARLTLTVLGPGLLFGAVVMTAAGRAIVPKYSTALGTLVCIFALAAKQRMTIFYEPPMHGLPDVTDVVEILRQTPVEPGARLYATPNSHLLLSFYTGLPVRDVAATRKSFLDNYPGEIILLDGSGRYLPVTDQQVQEAAESTKFPMSGAEARAIAPAMSTLLQRIELSKTVQNVEPPLPPAEPFHKVLFDLQREQTRTMMTKMLDHEGNPMFRGYAVDTMDQWWQIFFYRFVNPESRIGPNLNYANRLRSAKAIVLSTWVLYYCPSPTWVK
jgi:hypothetical protein